MLTSGLHLAHVDADRLSFDNSELRFTYVSFDVQENTRGGVSLRVVFEERDQTRRMFVADVQPMVAIELAGALTAVGGHALRANLNGKGRRR